MKHRLYTRDFILTLILRTIGNFMILSSLFFIGKTFYQPVKEEARYLYEQRINKTYVVAAPGEEQKIKRDFSIDTAKGSLSQAAKDSKLEVLVPIDTDFSVVIPKIAANSMVLPNVSVTDKDAYLKALQTGVAHAEGTAFPGEGGHIFMFAHSTDYIWNVGTYNAVFYLLYKLEVGDEINIFYKGQRYVYKVTGREVVDPTEVDYLTRKTDREFLTLQTCWPPGTTLKRQLVFAERVSE
ncbi:class E sortase [Candidatus Roizmanbacteria bacterium]|nr:MAG: class E sortase [Candidatus Roizmanbacteria bacterium]